MPEVPRTQDFIERVCRYPHLSHVVILAQPESL
jgi:hypothetical protein